MKIFNNTSLKTVLLLLTLSGCTNLRDLTPDEFRTQEFYLKTTHVNKSIQQIKEAYILDMPNRVWEGSYGRRTYFKENPSAKTASIWWTVGGFAGPATMAIMDFSQESVNPDGTSVKIYVANAFWEKTPQKFLDLLS